MIRDVAYFLVSAELERAAFDRAMWLPRVQSYLFEKWNVESWLDRVIEEVGTGHFKYVMACGEPLIGKDWPHDAPIQLRLISTMITRVQRVE